MNLNLRKYTQPSRLQGIHEHETYQSDAIWKVRSNDPQKKISIGVLAFLMLAGSSFCTGDGRGLDTPSEQKTNIKVENPDNHNNKPNIDKKTTKLGKGEYSVPLPLAVRGGSGNVQFDGFSVEPIFAFDHQEIQKLFPSNAVLDYEITQGNPTYTLEETNSNGYTKRYPLTAYRLDNAGKLFVQDAWLLGRNAPLYHKKEEQFHFFERGRSSHPKQNQEACGKSTPCPSGQEYTLHRYYFDYTFARTQDDLLIVQVQNKKPQDARTTQGTQSTQGAQATNTKYFQLHIKANPYSMAIKNTCAEKNRDLLDNWACQHTQEILPNTVEAPQTTQAHTDSLPTGLAKPKDEYQLVANIEFDSLEHTKQYFHAPKDGFADASRIEVRNGTLILHNKKIVNQTSDSTNSSQNMCKLGGGKSILDTKGKFEIGSGYLELKIDKYPNLPANGGNIILWSRYGDRSSNTGHRSFSFSPPQRILEATKSTSATSDANASLQLLRPRLAKIGFTEIDFMERWEHKQVKIYFGIHTYPLIWLINFYNTSYLISPQVNGHIYQADFPFAIDKNTRKAQPPILSHSAINGIEISPSGVQIYQNGSPVYEAPRLAGYFVGPPLYLRLHGIYSQYICTKIRDDEDIILDYIRLYKPKNGYK